MMQLKPASKLISSESQLKDKEGKILRKLYNPGRFTVLIVQIYSLDTSHVWAESIEAPDSLFKAYWFPHLVPLITVVYVMEVIL